MYRRQLLEEELEVDEEQEEHERRLAREADSSPAAPTPGPRRDGGMDIGGLS